MQNEQDQQMRIKFGNTPAGLCLSLVQNLLCWLPAAMLIFGPIATCIVTESYQDYCLP